MCARWAGSDLESLCGQRVLERLKGEERRDYGRILLSMADGKYAHAPGTSSAANGGRSIRRRIEPIARFKRYPAGMALVSVCVALSEQNGLAAECVRNNRSAPDWAYFGLDGSPWLMYGYSIYNLTVQGDERAGGNWSLPHL